MMLAIQEKAAATGKEEAYPMSIRRVFYVTPTELADFRGRKASVGVEMITRRGMFEILSDGSERAILPGDVVEMDDYSANQPYHFRDPQTGEERLCRQVLAARDLCSASWLSFDHIGRERDAYRGEDIIRYVERHVRVHGKPRKFRWERGTWESESVHGIEVPGLKGRWGDLRDLFEIDHVFKSKSKGIIEGGFNVLQRWLGHAGTDIGRTRGEFEEATKRARQARTTAATAAGLGFLTQDASSIAHEEAARTINSRPMLREHLGERVAPDDLVARLGWHSTPLAAHEEWYFLPCKQARVVMSGCVEVNPGGGWPKLRFIINGVVDGLYLETGHRILIACDPARPDLGARICNAERGVKNRAGWPVGHVLIEAAPFAALAPQFNASGVLSPHLIARKKSSAAASTTFRAIRRAAGVPQASGTREAAAFDGRGNAARAGDIARNESTTADAPPAAIRNAPVRNPAPVAAPARSSRGLPPGATRADEIARLRALAEAEA